MIKGDTGKESFARAQGKYLYQCEVKASRRWCQAAGIFIVYKLLLLQLDFGREGTKERTVSQQESLSFDKRAWGDRHVKTQKVCVTTRCRLTCPDCLCGQKDDADHNCQPPLAKVTRNRRIMRF